MGRVRNYQEKEKKGVVYEYVKKEEEEKRKNDQEATDAQRIK
jgi:hypothetical protein